MTFNLIHEPWIPIRTKAGGRQLISIREALVNAHEHLWLDSEACLENTAIHRLLAAILHDAYQGPTSTRAAARLYAGGRFDRELLEEYLGHHAPRFGLLDPDYPFWQIPGFTATKSNGDDGRHPIQFLSAQHSSGTQVTLFDKSVDNEPLAVTPATAARWLLACQAFRPAVGKSILGKPISSPFARAALLTPQGKNLFETLALSLTVYDPEETPTDAPNWRQEPPTVDYLRGNPTRASRGRLDEYTWIPQAIRLHPTETDEGLRITHASWANGVKPAYAAGETTWSADPMLVYTTEALKGGERRRNGVLRMRENHAWRDYCALLPNADPFHEPSALIEHVSAVLGHLDDFEPIRITMSGQLTEQASIRAWRSDIFTIPAAAFTAPLARQTLEQFIRDVNRAAYALSQATQTLLRERHSNSDQRVIEERVRERLKTDPGIATFWARGELLFREFIDHLITTPAAQVTGATPPDYLKRIQRLAIDAFNTTISGDADTSRHYRAAALALNTLHPLLPRPPKADAAPEEKSPEAA